jgi:histidyl-tRNA synthetase
MSKMKPSAPKGMRDFGPQEMARRNYIFQVIRNVYEKYGFEPIETPAMEKLETLTGKYGEEGDRLIFKVLNSGDYLKEARENELTIHETESKKFTKYISEKALRYDLTIPFARFVVQHFHELPMPFRRYQIQPVWRADNPQKGRYREFYQCDADIIGSNSLLNECELVSIFYEALHTLKIDGFKIHINNRKILAGIAEVAGIKDHLTAFTVALDKLDKIGKEKVLDELKAHTFSDQTMQHIEKVLTAAEQPEHAIEFLSTFLADNEIGKAGLSEIKFVIDTCKTSGIPNENLCVDFTLARGLDYYTGCIFEVKVPGSGFGSIAAGGRYDNLTGVFGMDGLSGVGISFGADRIYDLLLNQNLFPALDHTRYQYFFLNFGEVEANFSFQLLQTLRRKNVKCGIYPDAVKIKKQMEYADKIQVRYVCSIGSNEMNENVLLVKNMQTGEQSRVTINDFIEQLEKSHA